MHTSWKLIPLVAIAAGLGACGTRTVTTREVVREQPIVQQVPAPTVVDRVAIVQQPAAPQEYRPAPPAPTGYTWIPGYYAWQDGRWTWQPGQWHAGTVRPMPAPLHEPPPEAVEGSRWVPGYWAFSGTDWVWVKGRWQ